MRDGANKLLFRTLYMWKKSNIPLISLKKWKHFENLELISKKGWKNGGKNRLRTADKANGSSQHWRHWYHIEIHNSSAIGLSMNPACTNLWCTLLEAETGPVLSSPPPHTHIQIHRSWYKHAHTTQMHRFCLSRSVLFVHIWSSSSCSFSGRYNQQPRKLSSSWTRPGVPVLYVHQVKSYGAFFLSIGDRWKYIYVGLLIGM